MTQTRIARPALLTLATALVALAGAAVADMAHPTAGLWEYTTSTKMSGGDLDAKQAQLQQQMASMTPEQRAMMEKAMAGRGIQMNAGGTGTTLRVCVSKEQAAKDPAPPKDGRCEHQVVERTGSSMKYRFTCQGENGRPPTTGEGTWTMTSATSWTGTSVIDTTVQGKPTHMNQTMTGKWLGADCGDVKPLPAAGH